MEKYNNEEYLKSEIVDQSRHQFVYGYANPYRSEFLKSLEDDYPVVADSDKPVAVYLESFGLPNMDLKVKNKYYLQTMANEYFQFLVASRLMEKAINSKTDNLNDRFERLISLSNRVNNTGSLKVETVQDLLRELKKSRDFYYQAYIDYINGKIESIPIGELAIPFLQLEMFVSQFKSAMNMDSHICLMLDNNDDYLTYSIQTVNNFVGSRINGDISMKVVTEPDGWKTYRDINGQFVEAIHDYGDVQLDDSYDVYMDKYRR